MKEDLKNKMLLQSCNKIYAKKTQLKYLSETVLKINLKPNTGA